MSNYDDVSYAAGASAARNKVRTAFRERLGIYVDFSPGRPPTNEDFSEAIIGPADTARADRIGILIDRWEPGARRWARDSGVTGR